MLVEVGETETRVKENLRAVKGRSSSLGLECPGKAEGTKQNRTVTDMASTSTRSTLVNPHREALMETNRLTLAEDENGDARLPKVTSLLQRDSHSGSEPGVHGLSSCYESDVQ
jgi:hypothetical protein